MGPKIKIIVTICLAIVFVCEIVQSAPSGKCPKKFTPYVYFLQDTVNVNQFYMCDHGRPVRFDCPSTLVFNPLINVSYFIFVFKHKYNDSRFI